MSETYDKENHWYGWNGGECPVHPETTIEAITVADKDPTFRLTGRAGGHHWGSGYIIAFRIIKLYREPRKAREWWIASSPNFFGHVAFGTYAEANKTSAHEIIHVREVLEGDE
jgi:hypothetical protein